MIATLVSTLICSGIIKFQVSLSPPSKPPLSQTRLTRSQMGIDGVCTLNPPMRFKCPGPNTFFTASVLWGTIGPIKVFGKDGQYKWLLLGFPLGIALVLVFFGLKKLWPNNRALRQIHLVAAIAGGLQWAPYSTFFWFCLPISKS